MSQIYVFTKYSLAGDVLKLVDFLPSMHEVLGFIVKPHKTVDAGAYL